MLEVRQPDSVRLVPPHGNVESKHGDHQQGSCGVAAGKRPMVHLDGFEVTPVVHWSWPAHDLLDNRHKNQVKQKGHEEVEEKLAKLRGEFRFGRQVSRSCTRDEEHAVTRKLQGAQKHVKEDAQSMFMNPGGKLSVELHHVVENAQIRGRLTDAVLICVVGVITIDNLRFLDSGNPRLNGNSSPSPSGLAQYHCFSASTLGPLGRNSQSIELQQLEAKTMKSENEVHCTAISTLHSSKHLQLERSLHKLLDKELK